MTCGDSVTLGKYVPRKACRECAPSWSPRQDPQLPRTLHTGGPQLPVSPRTSDTGTGAQGLTAGQAQGLTKDTVPTGC